MKKFDVDLNQLELDEIEQLIQIVKKSKAGQPEEKVEVAVDGTEIPKSVKKKRKRTKGYKTKEFWEQRFDKVRAYMDEHNVHFKEAWSQVVDTMSGGQDYDKYREYCHERGLDPKFSNKVASYTPKFKPKRKYKWKLKRKSQIDWDDRFEKVHESLKAKGGLFQDAYKKVTGNTMCGKYYGMYKDFCNKKGYEPLGIQSKHSPRKRRKKRQTKDYYDRWDAYFDKLYPLIIEKGYSLARAMQEKTSTNCNQSYHKKYRAYCIRKHKPMGKYKGRSRGLKKMFEDRSQKEIKEKKSVVIEKKFPDLDFIKNKESEQVLINIIKRMIQDPKNTAITQAMEGFLFGVQSYEWKDFLMDFSRKSQEIAEYFGVGNKFKIVNVGKEMLLRYG